MSPSSLFFFFSWLLDCARYLSSLFSSPICSLKNLSHACSLFLSEFSILRELGVFCSSLEHGRWWWCDVQCSCGLWARRWESCRLPWPWPACFVRYDWVLFFSHLSRLLENAYLVLLMTCVRIFFFAKWCVYAWDFSCSSTVLGRIQVCFVRIEHQNS